MGGPAKPDLSGPKSANKVHSVDTRWHWIIKPRFAWKKKNHHTAKGIISDAMLKQTVRGNEKGLKSILGDRKVPKEDYKMVDKEWAKMGKWLDLGKTTPMLSVGKKLLGGSFEQHYGSRN